jgi:hypothetical protein
LTGKWLDSPLVYFFVKANNPRVKTGLFKIGSVIYLWDEHGSSKAPFKEQPNLSGLLVFKNAFVQDKYFLWWIVQT